MAPLQSRDPIKPEYPVGQVVSTDASMGCIRVVAVIFCTGEDVGAVDVGVFVGEVVGDEVDGGRVGVFDGRKLGIVVGPRVVGALVGDFVVGLDVTTGADDGREVGADDTGDADGRDVVGLKVGSDEGSGVGHDWQEQGQLEMSAFTSSSVKPT